MSGESIVQPAPAVVDWTREWAKTESAVGTTLGYETNALTFPIYRLDENFYESEIRLSVKKQVTDSGTTVFWWGYGQQFNFQTALVDGNTL